MSNEDYLAGLVAEVSQALQPVTDALQSPARMASLLRDLGWSLAEDGDFASVQSTFAGVASAVAALSDAVAAHADLPELIADVGNVAAALTAAGAGVGAGLPAPLDQPAFWQTLPDDLLELLLFEHLDHRHPLAFGLLAAIGVLRLVPHDPDAATGRASFERRTLDAGRVLPALSAPQNLLSDVYGWGGQLDHRGLTWALAALLRGLRADSRSDAPRERLLDAYYDDLSEHRGAVEQVVASAPPLVAPGVDALARAALLILPVPPAADRSAAPSGVLFIPVLTGQAAGAFDLGGGATATVATSLVADQLHVAVHPDGIELIVSSEAPQLDFSARLDVHRDPGVVVAGDPASTRLELWAAHLALGVAGPVNAVEVTIEAVLDQLRVVVVPGESDGFLQRVIGSDPVQVDIGPGLTWSNHRGLRLAGEGSLDIELPLAINAGLVALTALRIRGEPTDDGAGALELSVSGSLMLGPVSAAVRNVGVTATARGADAAHPGNLGIVDVGFAFKPPDGAALSIDAGAVTGGGFLFFDPKKEQYAGGLHLEFEGGLTLNAIGLLTTRMPDGSRGFSLLVIVQASGFTPVQLGFGFTLNGVGGLLAINRTVAVDVLRAGVRNKTLDAILFSKDDPTPRAPQIVSTLQTVFPPAVSQYIFGPMALIGWGTPTLITIELALILELPAPLRLIVLGRLRAALPDPEHAIVSINLDVLGVIDFDRSELSVDATLYDSRVGPFALTGDMAARASWGSAPDFAMALGGFHPAYKPAPGFPVLRRLALALSTGNNPRVRMEAYFALTSNTVQVGARLELYVEAAGFSLEGGLGFDTLIQFSPFRLLAEIYAHLALKRGSTTLVGLDIHVHLVGPAPWVLWGEASFKILFISISIPFRATIGRPEETPEIEREEVWKKLKAELIAPMSWSAQLPPESGRLVVLRGDAGDGEVLAHPLGSLTVSQRVVPLERTLDLFGSVPPKDFNRFEIVGAAGLALGDDTSDYFAPAQFRRMGDAEKLSSPSFERMVSGVRLNPSEAVRVGYVQETPLDYEQSVILDIEQPAPERIEEHYQPDGVSVAALAEHGPAGTAELRDQGRAKFAPEERGPVVADPEYLVATKDGLDPTELDGLDGTYTGAMERLRGRPDRDELQVVRREEAVLA